MNVIAFDPGGVTGLAQMFVRSKDNIVYIVSRTADPWSFLLDGDGKWDYVVCENFTSAGRMDKNGLLTLRLIGGIAALARYHGYPLVMQQNQKRKPFQEKAWQIVYDLARQKGEMAYQSNSTHEISALAHLLAWHADFQKEKEGAVSTSL